MSLEPEDDEDTSSSFVEWETPAYFGDWYDVEWDDLEVDP